MSKTDAAEASPFAVLVQSARNDAKPSVKDEQQPQDEKNTAAPAPKTARETAREAGNKDKAEAQPAPIKAAKDASDTKSSEDKPAVETAEAPADPASLAVEMPQPEIPPAPQPQLVAAAPDAGKDNAEENLTAAPVPTPGVSPDAAPPPAPLAATPETAETETAAQPTPAQATQQAQSPDASSDAAQQVAASAAAQAASAQSATDQSATAQSSSAQSSSAQSASAQSSSAQSANAQSGSVQSAPPPPAETQVAAPTASNTQAPNGADAAKPGARRVQSQAGKDSGKDTSNEAQPSLARRDAQAFDIAFAAAPKSQPQAPLTQDTGLAVHGLTAAPAQPASSTAPSPLMQQVQVTAEPPKPNMPSLAVEIAARTQSGARQFDIRLDPPELGRVEVRLSIDATGKASAHLSADQPQTLDLLQKDAPMLARALRDAGLDVAQDGLNFSLRQQAHNQDQNQNGGAPRGHARGQRLSAIATIETAPAAISFRANGRLDIRV